MSKIDDGGPASKATLRDLFAGQALSGILADTTTRVGFTGSDGSGWPSNERKFRAAVAESAYAHADAMLSARKAVQP